MRLSCFQVAHERGGAIDDNVLVHCWDERQLVLAFISREALEDYFRRPSRLRLQQCNLLVERNLEEFKRIIAAKYKNGDCSIYSRYGNNYPRVDITLSDIEQSGELLTDFVLEVARLSNVMTLRLHGS